VAAQQKPEIRDWVLRFNAGGPDALLNGKSPGKPSKLNDLQRQAIAGMIESGARNCKNTYVLCPKKNWQN
jgi:transposase